MEKFEDKILDTIEKDMSDNANMVIDVVTNEIEAMRASQLGLYEAGLKKETETFLEKELSDLTLQATTTASRDRLKMRRELLDTRTRMMDEIILEVRKNIAEFVDSNEYKNYLNKHLDAIHIANGYFEVRKEDCELMKDLLAKRNLQNEVRLTHFDLGGFHYVDEERRLEYSCDFNEKIEEAREYFRAKSNFKLVEVGDTHES